MKLKNEVSNRLQANFIIKDNGMLLIGNKICVLDHKELKREIFEEAHTSVHVLHLGSTKMYHTLRNIIGGKE